FPVGHCHGFLARDARPILERFPAMAGVFAVMEVRAADRVRPGWPVGDYIVVYGPPSGSFGFALYIGEGQVVSAQVGCNTPTDLIRRGSTAVLEPPSAD